METGANSQRVIITFFLCLISRITLLLLTVAKRFKKIGDAVFSLQVAREIDFEDCIYIQYVNRVRLDSCQVVRNAVDETVAWTINAISGTIYTQTVSQALLNAGLEQSGRNICFAGGCKTWEGGK